VANKATIISIRTILLDLPKILFNWKMRNKINGKWVRIWQYCIVGAHYNGIIEFSKIPI
jgi:hypothetical protein